jgi:hypothetical protein
VTRTTTGLQTPHKYAQRKTCKCDMSLCSSHTNTCNPRPTAHYTPTGCNSEYHITDGPIRRKLWYTTCAHPTRCPARSIHYSHHTSTVRASTTYSPRTYHNTMPHSSTGRTHPASCCIFLAWPGRRATLKRPNACASRRRRTPSVSGIPRPGSAASAAPGSWPSTAYQAPCSPQCARLLSRRVSLVRLLCLLH